MSDFMKEKFKENIKYIEQKKKLEKAREVFNEYVEKGVSYLDIPGNVEKIENVLELIRSENINITKMEESYIIAYYSYIRVKEKKIEDRNNIITDKKEVEKRAFTAVRFLQLNPMNKKPTQYDNFDENRLNFYILECSFNPSVNKFISRHIKRLNLSKKDFLLKLLECSFVENLKCDNIKR